MKKILFVLAAVVLMACEQAVQKSALSIEVNGMSCSHSCAPFIEKKLNKTEGVLEAKVSFEDKTASVVIDENSTSKEEIVKKIESLVNGQYKVGEVSEEKIEDSTSEEGSNDEASIDFDISQPELSEPEVSASTGFQLPNIFSLLNSLLN